MRKLFLICTMLYSTLAIATNMLSLSSVSGTPQTEVEVVVSLDNSDAISALELTIPLGEHLQYVNGSAVLATERSNGHMITAAQVAQDLRIYVFSFANTPINGNTGELLRFNLKLGNEPADYALTPTIVLSNAQGTSIAGSTQIGTVTIQAPKLQIVNPQIDYGHIPIRATYTKNLQLKNVGNLPLTIENITTTAPLFVPKQTTLTIAAGQTTSVVIEYTPTERGAVNTEAIVKSNAINGEQVATIMADPFSVNELHVGSTSGIADSIVTISLTMNNMEPIVAMQCAFKLPKQLEYVANSLAVNATRSNGHQALSTLRGDTLFLAIFSMTNQPLHANDGEVATFQFRLNGSSGTYYLKPIDVVLSNITEENMVSATSQGSVRINAPSISSNASLSFGNIPITEVAHATYSVRNNGSAPLVLERATFLAEGYSIVEELPITIANSKTTTITVAYQPTEEGDFSTTMNLYTNDPNNRLKTVTLSGQVYEPNTLILKGQNNQEGTYTLSVALDNYTDIVAVQYDLHWRSDMTTSQSAFVPSARMQNHNAVVTPLDEDSYRIIIYSMSNATIAGHNGELHQLVFTPQGDVDYCGDIIIIDNIILSDVNSVDKASSSTMSYPAATSQYVEEFITACDQYVSNNKVYRKSGVYTEKLKTIAGCDSIVTLHLTIHESEFAEYDEIACDFYEWHDSIYTESGDYDYYTTTDQGCERWEVLHIIINNSEREECTITACESYEWNGQTYTESGTYTYTTTTEQGCEKIEVLHLTITNSIIMEDTIFGCKFAVRENGNIYTESGTYYDTLQTINGCDSIEVIHVILAEPTVYFHTDTLLCYGEECEWRDKYYTQEGTYHDTIYNMVDCDSIIYTLNLKYHPQTALPTQESVTICFGDTLLWNNQLYTTSGTYTITLQNSVGCDSIVILNLTVLPQPEIDYEYMAIYIDMTPYIWRDKEYYETGLYEDSDKYAQSDCDSITYILDLEVLPPMRTEQHTLTICENELPYTWRYYELSSAGKYKFVEQYEGVELDSVCFILDLNIYSQTLPAAVTLPIVRTGEAIDVTIPTAEIQAHIATETWYAPNALVTWYIMDNSDWAALSAEPVAAGTTQVVLKYAVETDCGNIESENMVIAIEPTGVENTQSPSPISNCQKILHEDHIYILRESKIYTIMGAEVK